MTVHVPVAVDADMRHLPYHAGPALRAASIDPTVSLRYE
jgi:hypothetical protein